MGWGERGRDGGGGWEGHRVCQRITKRERPAGQFGPASQLPSLPPALCPPVPVFSRFSYFRFLTRRSIQPLSVHGEEGGDGNQAINHTSSSNNNDNDTRVQKISKVKGVLRSRSRASSPGCIA